MELRFAIAAVLLAAGAAPPLAAEEPRGAFPVPASWPEYTTAHYTLRTPAEKAHAKDLADFMELVYKTYSALLVKGAPPKAPKYGNRLILFPSRAAFLKAGMPPSVGAFYRPSTGELVGYYHPTDMKPFFAHEGMHQFTDLTLPGFKTAGVPMWFTEGIADCIGNSVERDGKLYMCSMSGQIAFMRLPTIHAAIREGRHIPLERFLALDRQSFMADAGLCYAQAWSFCHFLMTAPKKEDPAKQIPDGRYRKALTAFFEALLNRKTGADAAWAQAMQAGRIASVAALEEEWKAYVLELHKPDPDGPWLGIKSDGKRGEEGVFIGEVLAGSPAEKGGLQAGDQVVKFGGKPVELWNDFMSYLRSKKAGDKIVIAVKRGEKTEDITITLERRGER
jgi:membrane-associated protease RseP (regulator of RpoE activity)